LLYLSLAYFTKPLSWGDTIVYAPQIIAFSKGLLDPRFFWEFGHLLWRPLGSLAWHAGFPSGTTFDGNESLQVYVALAAVNHVLSYIAALASFGIAWRISRSALRATLIAGAFLAWNPFLNYMQSGTAYVPGLAMQLVGAYLLLGGSMPKRSRMRAWLGGAALAFSVCLWFPYFLGLPGVFLLAYLWDRTDPGWSGEESRIRLRWVSQAVCVCALVGFGCYAVGASLAGIRTGNQLKAWVVDSGHGYQPDKRYIRVATGMPRGLVYIGDTGLMLKRLVLHDPYAPVGIQEVLRTAVSRMLLFYIAMAALIWALMRDPAARPVALPFLLSGCLVVFFSVVVFEPSQSERWLPIFPVLLPAIAFVLQRRDTLRLSAAILALALAVIWANNFSAYASSGEPGPEDPAVARILAVKSSLGPHSVVSLLSFNDGISSFLARFPFHPINRVDPVRFYYLTEVGNTNMLYWRKEFAARSLQAWKENGDMWVSKRLLAEKPAPEWFWVEGDDPNLRWKEIPSYFGTFTFDRDVGGSDGFKRVARTPGNQASLEASNHEGAF